jgi:N-acyl-D-aspartate/D-glutamate deacylase
MGLDRATRKDVRPSVSELARMESMLNEALDEGFVGMSSQKLLFDKLDGEVCRSRTLLSTNATSCELRRLNAILRRRNKILQSGPDIKNPLSVISQLATSLGFGRPRLKTSLLSAAVSRMVNRNDDTVSAGLVSGNLAFGAGKAAPALGTRRLGQFLRADHRSRKLAATA